MLDDLTLLGPYWCVVPSWRHVDRDLRHTCAALLIAQGAHPKAMMEGLGHSSITVTLDRYGHCSRARRDDGGGDGTDLSRGEREQLAAWSRPGGRRPRVSGRSKRPLTWGNASRAAGTRTRDLRSPRPTR
jgi:hypothetical protein